MQDRDRSGGQTASEIRMGFIGLGGFGHYALQHFVQLPGVRPVCIAGTHRAASVAAAHRFGLPDVEDVESMLARDDIDLVYIATPPFLHHPQAMAALRSGKHVLCEKPLALTLEEADEMIGLARDNDLLVVANLMQRYNPLYGMVKRLIDSKALGEPLHGLFENYASDETLTPDHWFWDRDKSGGIFIEHAVHFFDMFAGWLGEGEVVAAQRSIRPNSPPGREIEDQVQCTVRYRDGIHVNQYHGFTQPSRMDRQEIRIVFERGDLSLFEWVPVRARIHGIANEIDMRNIMEIFEGARLDIDLLYAPAERTCFGRHKEIDVYQRFDLAYDQGVPKYHRYGEMLRSMLADQIAWITDHSHQRTITEENGRTSLALAAAANSRLAEARTQ